MATTAERLARELSEIRRRLTGLERSAAADLRSIDDGTQVVLDEDGTPVLVIGRQEDGTFAVVGENGGVVVADTARDGAITARAILDGAIGPEKVSFYEEVESATEEALQAKADAAAAAEAASTASGAASTAAEAAAEAERRALEALGAVDSKASIVFEPVAPAGAEGVYWVSTTTGRGHRWDGERWVEIQYADVQQAIEDASTAAGAAQAAAAEAAAAQAAAAEAQGRAADASSAAEDAKERANAAYALADGKVQTFFSEIDPVQAGEDVGTGDLWLDQGNGNALKRWSGSRWDTVQDAKIQQALEEAASAQAAADGKITTFYGDVQPEAEGVGDLWVNPAWGNLTLRWSGSSWDPLRVGADAIMDGAITETKIEDDSISTPKLAAGAVTVEKLEAGLLEAGFVLAGRIQVGEAYLDANEGLVIPQPDGGTILLPVDGKTSARITAHLVAKSLTIEDDTTIGGGASVIGTMDLADGIVAPGVAPALSQGWPSVQADFSYDLGDIYYGVTSRVGNPNEYVTVGAFFGASIQTVNATTGAAWGAYDLGGWGGGFSPFGGITRIGAAYFVLGQDPNRDGQWYVYRLDSNFQKVREWYWAAPDAIGGRPAIGNDGTNVVVAFTTKAGRLYFRRWTPNGDVTGSTTELSGWNRGTADLAGVVVGSVDLGGTPKVFIASRTGGVSVWFEGGARASAYDFQAAGRGNTKGLTWDSNENRFVSLDNSGRYWRYSKIPESGKVYRAVYTWYDGNTDGGTHETTASPEGLFVTAARTWLTIETPPAPEANNSDPNATNKADRIRVYASIADSIAQTPAPMLQASLARGVRTITLEQITSGATPPLANSFEDADRAPGRLVSARKRLDGEPKTMLLGSGPARMDGLVPPGSVTMFAGGSIPAGWLRCDGGLYGTAEYPDLFAAIGYTYGGSGSTFAVPDLRSRFPVGVGSIGGLGANEGIASDFNRPAQHRHAHAHGGQTGPGSQDRRGATESGNANESYATHRHSISSDDTGVHPHLGIHFIVRT